MFIQKSGSQIQCTKVPQCFVLKLGFFYTLTCGAIVPTPSSSDKAISANSVKSPSNKEKRWHSTADWQTLWWRLFADDIALPLKIWWKSFAWNHSNYSRL